MVENSLYKDIKFILTIVFNVRVKLLLKVFDINYPN